MITSVKIKDNTKTPFEYASDIEAFENGREFIFKPGVNVIIGKNGSGKSTLLNIISMYALCEKSMCSEIPIEALDFPPIFDDDDDDNAWCKETKNLPPTTKRLHLYPSLHTRSADGWHRFYWILYPSLHDYHVTTFHSFSLHRSRHAPHSLQLQWFYVNLLETHAQMLQCDCTRNPRLFRRFAAQRARRRASRTFREQQAAGVTVRPRRAALGLREKGPYSAGGDSAGGGFLADFRQWEVGGSDADHEFLFEEA